jgi:MoaA/NifB/PqqE/SkfB family radical SAM enzyme
MRLMRTPKKVDIAITNRCNLRCRYCYHFESAGDVDGDLPTGEWIRSGSAAVRPPGEVPVLQSR